MLIKHKVDHNS